MDGFVYLFLNSLVTQSSNSIQKISLKCVEIVGEQIRNLADSSKSETSLTFKDLEGYDFNCPPLIYNPKDSSFIKKISEANMRMQKDERYAAEVFMIRLEISSKERTEFPLVLIVDLPCSDALSQNPEILKTMDDSSKFQGIIAFDNIINCLHGGNVCLLPDTF